MPHSTSHSVCVGTFETELGAEVAKDLLAEAGIHAAVVADAHGLLPPMASEVRLMVTEEDAEAAREVLAQAQLDEVAEDEELPDEEGEEEAE